MKNGLTEAKYHAFLVFKVHEGKSSGEIARITGMSTTAIKALMRDFERLGFGDYTIQDGMYYFWFSAFGNDVIHEGM